MAETFHLPDLNDHELEQWQYRERFKPPCEMKRKPKRDSLLSSAIVLATAMIAGIYFWVSLISEALR